jgi:hypothetical protein
MKRCSKNHYYPDDLLRCPECPILGLSEFDQKAHRKEVKPQLICPPTNIMHKIDQRKSSVLTETDPSVDPEYPIAKQKMVKPNSDYQKEESSSGPSIVGWIVPIQGPAVGSDFRILSGRNYIGRSNEIKIDLKDKTISKNDPYVIEYDGNKRRYWLCPSNRENLTYLNGKIAMERVELKDGDKISCGKSEVVFVALINERFCWPECS